MVKRSTRISDLKIIALVRAGKEAKEVQRTLGLLNVWAVYTAIRRSGCRRKAPRIGWPGRRGEDWKRL